MCMRKCISYLVTILSTVLIVFGLFSCDMDVGVKTPGNETKATGKITGKVMYSNVEGDNHNGIILTLDKTDGLVTQNVMNVMQGRVQTDDTFQSAAANARSIVANNVTLSDGSYTFENLAEGTYSVYAASSYSTEKAVCTNVVVRAAETTVADVLKLTATGSISGRITLDNGTSGNTGFLVFVAGTSYMAMTDDAGNYTISGVPAGSGYQVVATKNGVIHNLSSNVTVTANGSAALADNNFTSSEIDNTVQGEKGETGAAGVDGKDGISMVWLGAFDSVDEIENPVYLNAFFNMTDGCSYIYNGSYWELLARSGANGKDGTDGREINWLGSYNDEEELYASCSYYSGEEEEYHAYIPQYLDAYFNKTNGCSYIYKNGWQLLAKSGADGADGKSINWRGYYSSEDEINNPKELDVYFNNTDGCSYIYAGGYWRKLAQRGEKGTDGTNGKGINWLGSYQSEELLYEDNSYGYTDDDDNYYTITFTPQYLDAYYNEIDGCSYIYYGCWTLLAKGGNGIKWLGSYSSVSEIDNPKEFDAFFNYTTGCSYIYTEYDGWTLLASKGASGENGRDGTDGNDGENGKSFRWRGSYSSSDNISTPQFMDVYHNTTDGCSYIFDGSNWQLLASKGDTGAAGRDGNDGKDGENGKSIKWLGSYSSLAALYEAYGHYDPVEGFWYYNPKYLDAYYNTTDGCSYIWNEFNWNLLSQAGTNGFDGKDGDRGNDGVNALALGTSLNTETITNQDVIITINVTKTDVESIGFVYSAKPVSYFNAKSILNNSSFNSIYKNSDGKYRITASENGYYAIAVKDSDGYTAFTTEYISNIDKTPAQEVSNLNVRHFYSAKTIIVNWTKPLDRDFSHVNLSYSKAGSEVISNVQVTSPFYTIDNVEVDGDEYVFTLCTVDNAGNVSESTSVSITPINGPSVLSISLDRYHFIYNEQNQNVTAVVRLSNAELLTDETIVKIQLKNESGRIISTTTAAVDKKEEIAYATLNVPSTGVYTVLCKIEDNVDTIHTASFCAAGGATIDVVNLLLEDKYYNYYDIRIPLGDVTSSITAYARIYGTGLDFISSSTIYIQLYDSKGIPCYSTPIAYNITGIQWSISTCHDFQYIDIEISLPTKIGFYTLVVLSDFPSEVDGSERIYNDAYAEISSEYLYATTQNIEIYDEIFDEPTISSLSIPMVSYTKEDNTIIATITGKNLCESDFDLSKLSAICISKPSIVANTHFEKINDTVLTVTFTNPGKVGNYDIIVCYDTQSVTSTLKVKDFTSYHVGDVLLNDGTIIPYNSEALDTLTYTDEQKAKAVGVLYFTEYDVPGGWLGIHNSGSDTYQWAAGITGYFSKFINIICNSIGINKTGFGHLEADLTTFAGDTDGKDNWAYICSQDPIGTADAAKNYPAFNYVNTYASTYNLTGDYAKGWYMPTLAELCYIYRNMGILDFVINALSGRTFNTSPLSWYWTSSQSSGTACVVEDVDFNNGNLGTVFSKQRELYVCCVYPFDPNAEYKTPDDSGTLEALIY